MVPAKSGIKSLTALKGATVCVEKGTTSSSNLAAYSAERGLNIKPLVIDSALEVADQFFAGKCRAYTADVSQLAGARVRAPGGPQAMVILPDRISKEPLGPVVRDGDEDWFTLVRWVLFMLIGMEEAGLTAENMAKRVNDPHLKHAIGDSNELSRMLGVKPGWALRTLQTVGNYGQMYERNLGPATPLKLERGLNKLWTDGGLMYAPPLQ
jgi:general L-amino acid transport system substrate-binding protein